MASYEDQSAPWLRNRSSDGSLKNAILKGADLVSSMTSAAVNRSQLVANPWDAPEGENGISDGMVVP